MAKSMDPRQREGHDGGPGSGNQKNGYGNVPSWQRETGREPSEKAEERDAAGRRQEWELQRQKEEEFYEEEYQREEKREKRVLIILGVIIVVLVAAITAGVILLIRSGDGQNQAPQLNEELRRELEKDDGTQEEAEDTEEGETDGTETEGQDNDARAEDTPEAVQTLEPTPVQETPQAQQEPQVTEDPVQTVTPQPTQAPAQEEEQPAASGDYILPDSDTSYVTEEDLEGLSEWELRVARNEIYARHGRIFTSADLAEYFAGKSWYEPTVPAESFDESVLNSVERENLQTILQYEREHGMNQ